MYRVLSCLTGQHDYRIVLLAVAICAMAAYTTFRTFEHALSRWASRRWTWLLVTGICAAAGIWSTHFVAMLAYDGGLPVDYEPVLTVVSLGIASAATCAGFALAQRHTETAWVLAGGGLIGAGIAAMHFTGMHALVVPGTLSWDIPLVVMSTITGIILMAASMAAYCLLGLPRQQARLWASGLMLLGICGLHFTAMGAVTVVPDPHLAIVDASHSREVLAIAVAAACVLILVAGIAAAVFDRLNADLAASVVKLQQAHEDMAGKSQLVQLGQLTATVAHEIRNPLGAIRTAAFMLERRVRSAIEAEGGAARQGRAAEAAPAGGGKAPSPPFSSQPSPLAKLHELDNHVQRINNGLQRCDAIITELLDLVRTKAIEAAPIRVDDWVRKVTDEEAARLPASVRVRLELGLGDLAVPFDGEQMRRVLINLISNASEAMVGKNGEPEHVVTSNPEIVVSTLRVGETVEICVRDNGPGITPDNLRRVLEPLFTTKNFGVGLGLPAVEKVLHNHCGGLRIASRLGHGTAMTAWLPIAPAESRAA